MQRSIKKNKRDTFVNIIAHTSTQINIPQRETPNIWQHKSFAEVVNKPKVSKPFYMGENEEDYWETEMLDQMYMEQSDTENHQTPWPELELSYTKCMHLWQPWKRALVIKLLGKNISYGTLHDRLHDLWKITDGFELTDLEENYYMVRFYNKEDYDLVLEKGHG